ncbi:MAG: hypothetical protein IKT52_08910 [Oscillospiraceae bacterium]|nr:hypothetical protein [Oscillospiraceae bacterium]
MSYRNNEREHEDEDDIVLAPMNVEGMPWYRKDSFGAGNGSKKKYDYSKKETFYIILGTLKASLLIAGAFIVVFFLFILLLTMFA